MKRGFTLIELMIVVIIIGILATFAVPQYLKAIERAKGGKARHALGLIAQSEKMYRAEHDKYVNCANADLVTTLGPYIEMTDIQADPDWDYVVSNAGPAVFTATATRATGTPNANKTIIVNQDGAWSGDFTP